jgi:predicted nucleic acid-binding protein
LRQTKPAVRLGSRIYRSVSLLYPSRTQAGPINRIRAQPGGAQGLEEICETASLDIGEAEATTLAQECQAERFLLDDQRAVDDARDRGLLVTRTPVIDSEANLRGWVPSVREKLEALRKKGFRLSERHYRLILKEFGES